MSSSRQVSPTVGTNTGQGTGCTPEGLTFAGIPLLQRTLAGFAPRPADEIGKLLSGAFGFEFSPTRIQPRLAVIAEALNRGDLARAMVATAHMALPDLNSDAALRLAKAHEALVKYDPDEPRDARGRWTAADSSGDGTGGGRLIPVSDPEAANDNLPEHIRQAFEELRDDPRIINHIFTNECIKNIEGGDYYSKTQDCAAANRDCEYLIKLGEEDFRRQTTCVYPDGAIVFAKGGILIPVRFGHKW